jgi:hypothetical protein
MAFIFGQSRVYEFTQDEFGLYKLFVRPARPGQDSSIPAFLRPPPLPGQVPGGLARQTTFGNYHGPTIQHHNGHEVVLLDRNAMQTAVRLIQGNGYPILFL